MPIHDFSSERLYVDAPLAEGARITCTSEQINYLKNVLRLPNGASLLIFNGHDGEWQARLVESGKRALVLEPEQQTRPQEGGPDVVYLFAPLKRSRLDYMVQKAVEMGVARLAPVITRHTIAERVNIDRMRANVIEAAEQCGILRVPEVAEPEKLSAVLANWQPARHLIFCDERAPVANPVSALSTLQRGAPLAVLIGPEGGFAAEERTLLGTLPFAHAISLGPRIMRADTAAVAALTVVNAILGDWS